jgi:hypothetical protein
MTAAVLLVALVAEDPAVLRNAPRDDAPAQATLWRGDWLEVRGETAGFLRVWDHRRERPGYVRPQVVRVHRLDAAAAPELAAVVRFLRDSTGNESLGIGYAALALRAAPAGADESEILAAIGTMADRLARRASARHADARDLVLAAHVEVAESYGVRFKTVDATVPGGRARVCYDGEAWEQVLAAPEAAAIEKARAALALAGEGCKNVVPSPAEERAWNDRRVLALEGVDLAALPAALAGRVRLRRAEAQAWRGFDEARRGAGAEAAARAETAAVRELALTDRGVLAPEDLVLYDDVAVRVAASRFAAETPAKDTRKRAVAVEIAPRAAGETCVRVTESGGAKPRALGERCTYGVVWPSALRWSSSGTLATIAVQPLPAWTELWVLRRADDAASWTIDTLTPAATDPDVGYVESAGFSPDGARLLVAREARVAGRVARKFQVLALPTLAVEKQAGDASKLLAFKRWSAPSWRTGTLALR